MKRYTDFLKDSKFIQWQLLPDDALNKYWQDFTEHYPESEKEIQRAIVYLKHEGLNKSSLDETERALLFDKIQATIWNRQQTKQRRLFWYAAAAVSLLVIGLILFYTQREDVMIPTDKELIVGELLNSEDIQLITSEESITFQNDIDVKLSEKGKAEIMQKNKGTQEIDIRQNQLSTLIIPYGKRSTLTLADGSKVWLNSGSVLEFPAQFGSKKREIGLRSGEMYIEVTPDQNKPFFVHTSNFNVKVYGTKFNLSNYTGSPQTVVLVEGSVSLQSTSQKELFITPNEKAVYSGSGTFATQKVDVNQFISWKEGYLSFDKTPITEVLQQIGRYYNLSFDYEQDVNLQKRTCSGKIYLSENMDNVMSTIGLLSSTIYTRIDNQIFISHKPL
ncbi:MAG: FecR domain-containing protein [Proteiniphilum sp.]|nr:FecR domain-containing protein [Proteiniphilum sp.]MDD4158629.1 FecR domain-containing protein [Proteiniphilum sp.]MDD4800740.1 FecR domain-containing protein [Proteiniphilum sp.]